MGKFWTNDVKAVFRRHPLRSTAILAKGTATLVLFIILAVIIGGILILANKNDVWVEWWLP